MNDVVVPRLTTVPPPNTLPALYTVPLTGADDKAETLLRTTRYSSAPEAVKDAAMEDDVMAPKIKPAGAAAGTVQGVPFVATLPVKGATVKYFGPPLHNALLTE